MAESPGETRLDSDKELLSSWTVVHRDGHTDSSREPSPVDRQDYGSDIEILHEEGENIAAELNVTDERKEAETNDVAINPETLTEPNFSPLLPVDLDASTHQPVAHEEDPVDQNIAVEEPPVTQTLTSEPQVDHNVVAEELPVIQTLASERQVDQETGNSYDQDASGDLPIHQDVVDDYEDDQQDGYYDDDIYEYERLPDAPLDENSIPHNELFVETSRHYIHVRNRTLNTRLNLIVCLTMLFVLAFGLGHYIEWSSRSHYQNYLKNLEEELVTCHADDERTATEYQARIDQLLQENEQLKQNLTLAAQQGMDSHIYREELNLLQNENADLKETVAKLRYMNQGSTETQTSPEQLRDFHVSPMSELERVEMAFKETRQASRQTSMFARRSLTPDTRRVYDLPVEPPRFIDPKQQYVEYLQKNANLGRPEKDDAHAEHTTESAINYSVDEIIAKRAVMIDETVEKNTEKTKEEAPRSPADASLGAEQKREAFSNKGGVFHEEQKKDMEIESPSKYMKGQNSKTPTRSKDNFRGKFMREDSFRDKRRNSGWKDGKLKKDDFKEKRAETEETEALHRYPRKELHFDTDFSETQQSEYKNWKAKNWNKFEKKKEDGSLEWSGNQHHRFHERTERKKWKKENKKERKKEEKKARDETGEDLKPEFVTTSKLSVEARKLSSDDRKLIKEFAEQDFSERVFGPENKKRKERKEKHGDKKEETHKKEEKHKTHKREKEHEESEIKKQIEALEDQLKKQQDKMNKILDMLVEGKNKEETMANTLTETLTKVSSLIGNLTNSSMLGADNIAETTKEMFVNFQSMYDDISLPDDVKNKLKEAKDALHENIVNFGTHVRDFLKGTETKDIPKKVGNVFKNTVYSMTKFGKNMFQKAKDPAKEAVKNVVNFVEDWKEILEEHWTKVQEKFESSTETPASPENEYDSGFEDDLNDAEEDLQEQKIWEGVFVDANNDTQDGDWVLKRSSVDDEAERNSDWVFKRGEQRQKQREDERRSDWMFERAHGRKSARDNEEKEKKRKGEKKFDDSFKRKRGDYIEDHDDEDDDHDDDEDDGEEAYEKYTSPHHRESRRDSKSWRSKRSQGQRGYYHHHQTEEEDDDDDRYYHSTDWFYPDVYFQKVQEYLDALARMYE